VSFWISAWISAKDACRAVATELLNNENVREAYLGV